MLEENNIPRDNSEASTKDNSKIKNSRRSFLTKAVITGPIISTVASRPVWGAGICSLSGSLSGNLSNHGEQSDCDGPVGRSPGYWAQWEKITSCNESHWKQGLKRLYNWDRAGFSPTDSFISALGTGPDTTLGDVMRVGAGTDSFERHVIAALLSASHPLMFGLVPYTVQQVKDAYAKVLAAPGSQQATDIIAIFDALFDEHDEVELESLPLNYSITDQELAALSAIAGVASPRAQGACQTKTKPPKK